MSLKRKASFSTPMPPATPVCTSPSMDLDDSPKHLNSRTRKRFRNDRPDEAVVYQNTLRWLFTAQQRPGSVAPTSEDADQQMDSEPVPAPETVDPRQQTLLKFFQPAQSSRSAAIKSQPSNLMQINPVSFQQPHFNMASASTPASSDLSPSSHEPSMDMDVDMDSGSDESAQDSTRWAGGLGWM